ncbi:MAG TPA: dihydrofolate reductase family protein [Syntrophales bacterium]|nr:dihydrofolate reductase family protein [Syntrophales bacterium]
MGKLTMQMSISIDGCVDHTIAIADVDELLEFTSMEFEKTDILLFGRKCYQLMETDWTNVRNDPNATKSFIDFAEKIIAKPKILFSRTLTKANWNNTILISNDAISEVIKLKRQEKNLSIGGIDVSRELMQNGLIDDILLLVQPVIWGKGRRLFDGIENRMDMKLVETMKFKSGVVLLHYAI